MKKIIKKNLKGKKVLILGGTGFVGRATARAFAQAGAEVKAIGSKDYDARDTSVKNIKKLQKFIVNKDIIINLAAVVNAHDLTASHESQAVNVEFAETLLNTLKKQSPSSRVIFSSSQTVYGTTEAPFIDEYHAVAPTTWYGKQKREAEDTYKYYADKHSIPITVLRLSNIYGPEASSSRSVISLFLEKAQKNADITVFGDGKELRDYLHVDDAAAAFVVAAQNDLEDVIYNCGSGEISCLKEIAEMAIHHARKGKVVHMPFPPTYARYPGHIVLNSDKFKKETGWKPKIKLMKGIKKMLRK